MKMDLEVSEPIDFSSGDHQRLVRKAVDSNVQTKSSASTSSPSSEPQRNHGEPHAKTREPMDSYVVQISEDTTPEFSNTLSHPFSDSSIRRAFIIKVFLILSAQLVVTGAIISVFIFWKGLKAWVLMNAWFTYAILPAFFGVLIVFACCGNLQRQVPVNYILLGVFWDFTMLNGMLFVFLFVLLIYGIFFLFIRSYWLHLLYAGLGTVLFSLYLVMDVQLMVGGRHHHSDLHPEEYVFAALNIYLDIINLFLFILELIGLAR
ncbi:protein lifeguard 1 isoform X3 [Panthera tigris]|uniref:protein lifeguard 1 isoform X3 n=1 Tax=Panthera tigris TaxID=9694 RepID=UPI001C6FC2D0|nr:protein lifeguard 1 isoform X3 [Panthera tigris]